MQRFSQLGATCAVACAFALFAPQAEAQSRLFDVDSNGNLSGELDAVLLENALLQAAEAGHVDVALDSAELEGRRVTARIFNQSPTTVIRTLAGLHGLEASHLPGTNVIVVRSTSEEELAALEVMSIDRVRNEAALPGYWRVSPE